jgi:hypothetical protein
MNMLSERVGPVARLEEREAMPDVLRYQFANATLEEVEFAIQHLPPQAIETFMHLRRLKEEILVWRRRFGKHLRAS